jgi:hypothetical protein
VFGSGGDSGEEYETVKNPDYRGAGMYLSDAARARLGPQWTKNDPTSVAWGYGEGGSDYGLGWDNNWTYGGPKEGFDDWWNSKDSIQAAIKTADKGGTGVKWKRQGDSFVPVGKSNQFKWDTNPDHTQAAMAFAALGSLGLAAPAIAGAGAAQGGSVLGTGLSLGQIGSGLNFANMATGGNIPGLREAGLASSLFSGGAGIAGNLSNGINSASDLASLIKDSYNVYGKGSKLMDMFSGPDEQYANSTFGGGGQAAPRNNVNPPRASYGLQGDETLGEYGGSNPSGSSGGFDLDSLWKLISGGAGGGGTGLADLWGAWEGSRQAKDQGNKLQKWYSDELGRRQPHLDRLNESYTNPDSFYNSNQWKGLSDVYKNSIDRTAASKGRLANPTDREVLLQNHAMKSLEDYRSGLRGNAGVVNPNQTLSAGMRGAELESRANNPWGAAVGRGGVGGPGLNGAAGGIADLIKKIVGGGSQGGGGGGLGTNPDIAKLINQFISQPGGSGPGGVGMGNWSSGGDMDSPYNPYTGFNEPTFGGDTWGDGPTDWGPAVQDPDWGFNADGGWGFNADGGNGFDIGDFDVEDTGWIDDIGSWFDW